MILLLLACHKPVETPPPPPPLTPAELAGDWYLTDWMYGRRLVIDPCNADLSHLVLNDKNGHAEAAARRILAVQVGKVDTISGGDGAWRYGMADKAAWTFTLVGGGTLLRWEGGGKGVVGPWVRKEDLDSYELVRVPMVECGQADLLPVLPTGTPTRWWRVIPTEGGWTLPPGGGTVAPLEILPEQGLTVVRRNGAGETKWTVDVAFARPDGTIDLTVHNAPKDYRGMRIMTTRPPPPPTEVGEDGTLTPTRPPEASSVPLPDGARYIALPGEPAWLATVWLPDEKLSSVRR